MLENKKIFVLGLARSGYQVTKLLHEKNEIVVTDQSMPDTKTLKELEEWGVTFINSPTGEELLDETFDIMIKNPGIDPKHLCVQKANLLNIPIVNEMEVAYHYLPKNVQIIGITGSNGKTTTTTILSELLKSHGITTFVGGNIGNPLSEIVHDIKENSVLVLEISDHQLYNLKDFKTDYSILTNLCPTHLDFHGNYENYKNIKKRIFQHHNINSKAYINFQNPDSLELIKDINSTKVYFNNENNYYNEKGICIDNKLIVNLSDIKIKGNHNYENILASLVVLKEFAFDKDIIYQYFQKFNGVPHRIEIVDTSSNLEFYNDSKSTNPTSTLIALKTMHKPTHLILGGMERKQDFHELDSEINIVKCIYAIGEVTKRVVEYAKSRKILCYACYDLQTALEKIKDISEDKEIVLLSPASASWDQYDKFETRGEEFKNIVEKLFN